MLLDPGNGTDEVDGVGLMFAQARTDGEDIDVEDDVLRREADACQQVVGTLGNGYLSLIIRCLSLLVEGHHHNGSTQTAQLMGFAEEVLFSVFKTDGVDDALALSILQTSLDGRPVGRVDHQHRTTDSRVVADVTAEGLHLLTAVKHGIVHIDIDDGSTTLDLVTGYGECLVVFLFGNEAGKFP